MATLKEIFEGQEYTLISGSMEQEAKSLIYDSRKAQEGCVFFCHTGANLDAHTFIPQVLETIPAAVVVSKEIEITPEFGNTAVIKVADTRYALGLASARFFDHPAKKLLLIGVTGTKGKTSIASMVRMLMEEAGYPCGMIGTIGVSYGDVQFPIKTTTPESYDVENYLNDMVNAGCKACVMEVSSQAMLLNRVAGIRYDYAIFSNMSIDHIGENEHKDFADYVRCKSLLFRQCDHGIFNADDEQFEAMTTGATCSVHTFAYQNEADLKGYDFEYYRQGEFIGGKFSTKGAVEDTFLISAPGRFSMYNALPVIMLAHLTGISTQVVKNVLTKVHVKGRMEPVKISDRYHLLIDYAHNAVSTESILKAMREYEPHRIVSLFGCGGNRSRTRRYEMGEASGKYADLSIITEDNSRFEDVNDIIADILIGMNKTDGEYVVIPDRKEAIRYAIEHAQEGDIILLLGKGHEDYQEKNGQRKPFDERVIIAEILEELDIRPIG